MAHWGTRTPKFAVTKNNIKIGQVLPPPRGTGVYSTAGKGPFLAVRYEGLRLIEVSAFETLDEACTAVAAMAAELPSGNGGKQSQQRRPSTGTFCSWLHV
jgi:hypothetical protein